MLFLYFAWLDKKTSGQIVVEITSCKERGEETLTGVEPTLVSLSTLNLSELDSSPRMADFLPPPLSLLLFCNLKPFFI